MIQTVSINPPERAYTKLTISGKAGPLAGFPLLSIDREQLCCTSGGPERDQFPAEGWLSLHRHWARMLSGRRHNAHDRSQPRL